VEKVRAVGPLRDKLQLLNRGQRWVIRKIQEMLPTVTDRELREFLVAMEEGHESNIRAVDEALEIVLK
jgi:nitronate monooxygenase